DLPPELAAALPSLELPEPCPSWPPAAAGSSSRVTTGAGCAGWVLPLAGGSAQRTTVPSEYVCTTVNETVSVVGIGPRETRSSAGFAGSAGAPVTRSHVIDETTSVVVVPWISSTGWLSWRVATRGAQSTADIG